MDLRVRMLRIEERLQRLELVIGRGGLPPPLPRPTPEAPAAIEEPAPRPPRAPWIEVAAFEADVEEPSALGVRVPAAPPVSAPPARPPSPPRSHAARKDVMSTSGRDLERFVGVSILGRVGVAALLLAAGYFAQWTYVRIPPVARVASIYGLAVLLIGAGFFVRRRTSGLYVGILWGGGVAAAYLAGVVARIRYDLVGPVEAVAMLAAACVAGEILARRL